MPLGYLIDENGNPTTDPAAFKGGGSLLPFGEHKGFGVMVAVEILGRILSGADDYSDTPHGGVFFRHVGITMIVLDSGLFGSADSFATRGAELANRIRSIPPAPGFEKVLVAGDYEHPHTYCSIERGVQRRGVDLVRPPGSGSRAGSGNLVLRRTAFGCWTSSRLSP